MHFRGLNLNLLVSLDALLSEKSVTRAAERVHVTQPAMSAALHQLRDYLSDPLLERVGRQLELTPRGRELAVSVKELLLLIDTALNANQTFDPQTAQRTFRIAMSGHMAELVGVPLVGHLMKNAPFINFQIIDLAVDSLRRVEEGELDFAITVAERALSNPPPRPEVLTSRLLFSDTYVLVAARDNPAVDQHLTYDGFCALPLVEVRFTGNFMSLPEVALERQVHRPRVRAWMPTSQNVLTVVSATTAVAIVPSRLFELHCTNLRLKCVEPPLRLPEIRQLCFWHARNDIDPAHKWFGEILSIIGVAAFRGEEEIVSPPDR